MKTRTSFSIESDLLDKVKQAGKEQERSQSWIINKAITEYLKKGKP